MLTKWPVRFSVDRNWLHFHICRYLIFFSEESVRERKLHNETSIGKSWTKQQQQQPKMCPEEFQQCLYLVEYNKPLTSARSNWKKDTKTRQTPKKKTNQKTFLTMLWQRGTCEMTWYVLGSLFFYIIAYLLEGTKQRPKREKKIIFLLLLADPDNVGINVTLVVFFRKSTLIHQKAYGPSLAINCKKTTHTSVLTHTQSDFIKQNAFV